MIANVRQWNVLALPRLARRVMIAKKAKSVQPVEETTRSSAGFFDSYERMLESQAVLILGLNNKRW